MYFIFLIVIFFALFILILEKKNMRNWLPEYIKQRLNKPKGTNNTKHIMFSFVDHYEPQWKNPNDIDKERSRVDRWCVEYPKMASNHKDSDGYHPQHTFFYPEEEYRFEHLDKIANLCRDGYGEIEVHLHHDDDTSDNLRKSLLSFCETLHTKHGALSKHPETGQLMYGFIHGNWCLDNSRPDGKFCGVNDELIVLKETGCYADFTYPSAPSPTQSSTINSIYYATDDPLKPNSHDKGKPAEVGIKPSGDLLIVNGPLSLNWKKLKKGVFPQIENSDIRTGMEPTNKRVDLWVDANIHVKGQPDWIFIKIHTHGTQERDMPLLLEEGKSVDQMFTYLEEKYNDGDNYKLHYVNSREMFNIIRAAEEGKNDNPNEYRDYILPKPTFVANNQ